MTSPIVRSTIKACLLSGISNVIAQFITIYKRDAPANINWAPVLMFVLYTALNSPPNFIWQSYLEAEFPSVYHIPSTSEISTAASHDGEELYRDERREETLESKLSIRNTIIKFLLDQTVGAVVNTLLFSMILAKFKGAGHREAIAVAREELWPLMLAGWKLWPAVSAFNFGVVKTIEGRSLVGSLAGMAWGIYLSLIKT